MPKGSQVDLKDLARDLDAFVDTDASAFQRRARVLQSMWSEDQGFASGEHIRRRKEKPPEVIKLGSRLPMPQAEDRLDNFLTETVRDVVRSEVLDPKRSGGKLFAKPRIFNDLLSSQPLCFNLFGELSLHLGLASDVIERLTDGRFVRVTGIEFEESPGRGNPEYLNDRSAFDVFVRCLNADGEPCFIGIEVKYHENLIGTASEHKPRYDEVADLMTCFPDKRKKLMSSPLQQIWRDHLLTGITRIKGGYADALFVMLYPKDNDHVSRALENYGAQLTNSDSFTGWTLEDFVAALRQFSTATWIDDFEDRYLAFHKIELRLDAAD